MTSAAKWTDFASLDKTRMLAAASSLLPAWVSLLLVVLIAWQLAKIVWSLVPGPAAGDPVEAPAIAPVPAGSVSGGAPDVQAIAGAHIFGVASQDAEEPIQPAVEETENLRDTQLTNLSLKGTVAATPAERAVAIIADGSNEEKVYSIGETVASGATLHAVYADRVVLNEDGVLTNLKLPKEFSESTVTSVRRDTMTTSRAVDTESIQSVVAKNVSQLADVIRPTPYFVNGQQQGYRVYPGRDRQQFAALGLRPGDLIKDIDGQALTDPTQAMKIFQTLDSADQVSVTVERDGQSEVIMLSTSQLDLGDENNQ